MNINIRTDSVEIEGYVNAIERDSRPLWSRAGRFVERICKGAFERALKSAQDVHILLNHDWNKNLGSISQGNLELKEDSIGLYARATITDPEVIKDARAGNLVGWSFGFKDEPNGVVETFVDGIKHRAVKGLKLFEVSIINKEKLPSYEGTSIMTRADGDEELIYRAEPLVDEVTVKEETPPEVKEEVKEETEQNEPKQQEIVDEKYYTKYKEIINEMKED